MGAASADGGRTPGDGGVRDRPGRGLVIWQWRRAESKAVAEAIARHEAEDEGRRAEEALSQVERLSAGIALDQGNITLRDGRSGPWPALAHPITRPGDRAGDGDLEQVARRNLAAWQALSRATAGDAARTETGYGPSRSARTAARP